MLRGTPTGRRTWARQASTGAWRGCFRSWQAAPRSTWGAAQRCSGACWPPSGRGSWGGTRSTRCEGARPALPLAPSVRPSAAAAVHSPNSKQQARAPRTARHQRSAAWLGLGLFRPSPRPASMRLAIMHSVLRTRTARCLDRVTAACLRHAGVVSCASPWSDCCGAQAAAQLHGPPQLLCYPAAAAFALHAVATGSLLVRPCASPVGRVGGKAAGGRGLGRKACTWLRTRADTPAR